MKRVILGKTGLEVSRVGIGGIPIARPSEDEAIRIVRRALDLGINLIDTAAAYGSSEERFGKAIAGRREQVIIATKTNLREKAASLQQLEQSLKRLNSFMASPTRTLLRGCWNLEVRWRPPNRPAKRERCGTSV